MDIFNTKFKVDAYSDIGNKKKVNQDSLIVKQARTNNIGRVCFACLCDGMGGLSQGEVASASFVNRMGQWFENEFSRIIAVEDATEDLSQANPVPTDFFRQVEAQLEMIVRQMNQGLKQYGSEQGFKLGTTSSNLENTSSQEKAAADYPRPKLCAAADGFRKDDT